MRRTTIHILRMIPAALLLAACGDAPGGGRAGGPVRVGAEAPAYAAETLDGERMAISQLRGRPVLLNVWATWCHPCRQEIPALEQLHRTYAPRGLHVVGVSIDQGDQQQGIREFLQEYGASYPIWLDPDGEIQTAYSTMGVPNTFLIGPDGRVLWKHVGPVTADNAELVRLIEKSLPAAS
ncbi:MAG TPA: TlpA disulfide reductase family protein [Longimicrobium sp.]|jgi:cytochrome c biogenesis protein CcmG/thiol:disulfide interchange protein DsbE